MVLKGDVWEGNLHYFLVVQKETTRYRSCRRQMDELPLTRGPLWQIVEVTSNKAKFDKDLEGTDLTLW